MENKNRINIGFLARQIQVEGFSNGRNVPEIWRSLKSERYALTAVIGDRIIDRAYETRGERPPYGLAKPLPLSPSSRADWKSMSLQNAQIKTAIYHFGDLFLSMGLTLRLAAHDELGELEMRLCDESDHSSIKSVYRRLKELTEIDNKKLEGYMLPGIQTAVTFMSGLLETIPNVYKRHYPDEEFTSEKFVSIAHSSYPLIVELAASNIDAFMSLENNLVDLGGYSSCILNPQSFVLSGAVNQERLDLSREVQEKFEKLKELVHADSCSETVGCPALVNFGNGSAIKKLWDWHVEIAEKIYPHLVGDAQVQSTDTPRV